MSKLVTRLAVAALLLPLGVAQAQYARKNAIVEAVNKTKAAVVTLKVNRGDREVVGTGVVIDERGFMITNYHVISGATRIVATLSDNTKYTATVHATSSKNDLAILRLPVKGKIKALPVASASDVMVGETIIAVGNPYGFDNTVSTGIISALNREINGPKEVPMSGIIQHSASINPGNSGGPLLNINGELIGINVALRDGAQGIGFAINAETVKDVLARQLSASKVSKVAHGLSVSESVEEEGKERHKVVVQRASAGLKQGDIISKIGNLDLRNRFDVERAFWGYKAGDEIDAVVNRGGEKTTVKIKLAAAEAP